MGLLPVLAGVIDRRILVNYTVDAEVMARFLPAPFAPELIRGRAVAGICLIRLVDVRPAAVDLGVGIRSENAAHRIAVTWPADDGPRSGVYVPRRDTDSLLNSMVGGRLFPGEHHLASFAIEEGGDQFTVSMQSADARASVHVDARIGDSLPPESVFESVERASSFFETGSHGWSATSDPGRFDGLELRCKGWKVEPLEVARVSSHFFADERTFPPGSVRFDHALLMRNIPHTWHALDDLCC